MTLFVPNTSSKASAAPGVVYPSWKEERRRFLDTTLDSLPLYHPVGDEGRSPPTLSSLRV